jgi:hypothetical protein
MAFSMMRGIAHMSFADRHISFDVGLDAALDLLRGAFRLSAKRRLLVRKPRK